MLPGIPRFSTFLSTTCGGSSDKTEIILNACEPLDLNGYSPIAADVETDNARVPPFPQLFPVRVKMDCGMEAPLAVDTAPYSAFAQMHRTSSLPGQEDDAPFGMFAPSVPPASGGYTSFNSAEQGYEAHSGLGLSLPAGGFHVIGSGMEEAFSVEDDLAQREQKMRATMEDKLAEANRLLDRHKLFLAEAVLMKLTKTVSAFPEVEEEMKRHRKYQRIIRALSELNTCLRVLMDDRGYKGCRACKTIMGVKTWLRLEAGGRGQNVRTGGLVDAPFMHVAKLLSEEDLLPKWGQNIIKSVRVTSDAGGMAKTVSTIVDLPFIKAREFRGKVQWIVNEEEGYALCSFSSLPEDHPDCPPRLRPDIPEGTVRNWVTYISPFDGGRRTFVVSVLNLDLGVKYLPTRIQNLLKRRVGVKSFKNMAETAAHADLFRPFDSEERETRGAQLYNALRNLEERRAAVQTVRRSSIEIEETGWVETVEDRLERVGRDRGKVLLPLDFDTPDTMASVPEALEPLPHTEDTDAAAAAAAADFREATLSLPEDERAPTPSAMRCSVPASSPLRKIPDTHVNNASGGHLGKSTPVAGPGARGVPDVSVPPPPQSDRFAGGGGEGAVSL